MLRAHPGIWLLEGESRALAWLLAEEGEVVAARDLLAPIYASFTEGFDAPDVNEAKAVLDRLWIK